PSDPVAARQPERGHAGSHEGKGGQRISVRARARAFWKLFEARKALRVWECGGFAQKACRSAVVGPSARD
ncbi:MAG: hypothetical protein WD049_07980, partial [Candidatus Paceibacterota bacterium]